MTSYLLIGAGGHAATLVEMATQQDLKLEAFSDATPADWAQHTPAKNIPETDIAPFIARGAQLVLGFAGITPAQLARRHALMGHYQALGAVFPAIIHRGAQISPSAIIEEGAQIFAGAIVNAGAFVGAGCIINSGAIVEHHARIEAGCHLAPRACVLGSACIGATSFIGAGSTVIQGKKVPAGSFIKAHALYNPRGEGTA